MTVTGSSDPQRLDPPAGQPPAARWRYATAVGVVAVATALCGLLFHLFDPRNLAMIYLLGVAYVATRLGRGPSILASFLSVVSFEYFFIPPYFAFDVADAQYLFTFAVLLLVGLLISGHASRARAEGERARERALEAERERLRSALLSSVSHDLRTPLSVIVGAASSLVGDRGLDAAEREELASTIYEESDRLNRLLGNLLDMTRVRSGQLVVAKEAHALEEIVGAALRRLRSVLRSHTVRLSVPPDLPMVPLDALLVEQVLVNLLDNAARYAPPGSRIDVTAASDGRSATLEVLDGGPGWPAAVGEKLFEHTRQGGGLGLAICHAIVVAHGGHLSASNRPEGGARVSIVLPLSEEPLAAPEPLLPAHAAR